MFTDRKPRYMVFDPRYGEPARVKDWTMYPTRESAYNNCSWLEDAYWRGILEVRKVDWFDRIG